VNISPELRKKILEENVRVHAIEAGAYEKLHSEIYNWYEQKATWRRVHLVDRLTAGKSSRKALDIGCGTGNILLKLSSLGFDVIGLDVSKQMLDVLSEKGYPADRLIYNDVDDFLERYEGDEFDVITCSSVLHHLPDYLGSLSRAMRLLNAGGALLVMHEPVGSVDQRQGKSHLRLWTVVNRLSGAMQAIRLHLSRVRLGKIDYTFSDFHSRDGILVPDLISILTDEGLQVVEIEYYVAEKTGWGALLNSRIFRRPPNNFSLIAQK
jgi:2-polyprenyl-3-methyl-5-hydroxy-6-metoxy-1,4-benzoquinol methylase